MVVPKSILILGDSWSQGELKLRNGAGADINHKGLEQYLLDIGCNVTNKGGIGESNLYAYQSYYDDRNQYDLILWFQTDVLRDLTFDNFIHKLNEFKSIRRTFDQIQIDCYKLLNNLAEERHSKIYVIGGFTNVDSKIDHFKNLINYIPSVISLIDPEQKFSMYGFFPHYQWFLDLIEYLNLHKFFNNDDFLSIKEEFTDMIAENIKMLSYLKSNKKYFWPDGAHPNRLGHQVIFKEVLKLLENE